MGHLRTRLHFNSIALKKKTNPNATLCLIFGSPTNMQFQKNISSLCLPGCKFKCWFFAETDLRLWLHHALSLGNIVVFKSCFAKEDKKKISLYYRYSFISLNCTVICSVAYTKALATTWSNILLGKHGLSQFTCLLLWVLPVSINIKCAELLVSLPLPL